MAMGGNRAERDGEGREGSVLPLVLTCFNKMEEMIVGPMTRLNDGAALVVPGEAVGVAGPLRDDLKLARARMHAPKRAVELVFLAVVGTNPALIKHPIQPVEPAIR